MSAERDLLDFYNIEETPTSLRENLIKLRQDFDSHIHDGISSKTFQTLIAETVSARVLAVRKSSFTDNTAGLWVGLVGNQPKFFLGDSTNYFKFDQNGIAVSVGSSGSLVISNGYAAGASLKLDTLGMSFYFLTTKNGSIYMSVMGSPYVGQGRMVFQIGDTVAGGTYPGVTVEIGATSADTGDLSPGAADTMNLGTASNYWNEINYKTLTDRGCLGFFDDGVLMQDGRIVKDTEAIKSIQKHPTRLTVYGVPMLDYSTMPKAVYKPAPIAEENVLFPEHHPRAGQIRFYKGEKMGEDGAETTALISIMIGAIKELTDRVGLLEAELDDRKKAALALEEPVIPTIGEDLPQ